MFERFIRTPSKTLCLTLLLCMVFESKHANAANPAVEAIDQILGTPYTPYTVRWAIENNERNIAPGGCWSDPSQYGDLGNIIRVCLNGNVWGRIERKCDEMKAKYAGRENNLWDKENALKEIKTEVDWCIGQLETIKSKRYPSWPAVVFDDIIPSYQLGNGFYPLSNTITRLIREIVIPITG